VNGSALRQLLRSICFDAQIFPEGKDAFKNPRLFPVPQLFTFDPLEEGELLSDIALLLPRYLLLPPTTIAERIAAALRATKPPFAVNVAHDLLSFSFPDEFYREDTTLFSELSTPSVPTHVIVAPPTVLCSGSMHARLLAAAVFQAYVRSHANAEVFLQMCGAEYKPIQIAGQAPERIFLDLMQALCDAAPLTQSELRTQFEESFSTLDPSAEIFFWADGPVWTPAQATTFKRTRALASERRLQIIYPAHEWLQLEDPGVDRVGLAKLIAEHTKAVWWLLCSGPRGAEIDLRSVKERTFDNPWFTLQAVLERSERLQEKLNGDQQSVVLDVCTWRRLRFLPFLLAEGSLDGSVWKFRRSFDGLVRQVHTLFNRSRQLSREEAIFVKMATKNINEVRAWAKLPALCI
jgi:hypothetical protein